MILDVKGRETIELTDPYKEQSPVPGMTPEEVKQLVDAMKQKPTRHVSPIMDKDRPVIWTKLHKQTPKWESTGPTLGPDRYIHGLAGTHEPQKWEKNWS